MGSGDGLGIEERLGGKVALSGSRNVLKSRHQAYKSSMNFVDEVKEIITKQKIKPMDLNFFVAMDSQRIRDLEVQPEYAALAKTFLGFYEQALMLGLPKQRAFVMFLSMYEEIVRQTVATAVVNRMMEMGVQHINTENVKKQFELVQTEVDQMTKKAGELRQELDTAVRNKSVDQFKSFLLYAADQWGDENEKKAVASLVAKVEPPKIKKRNERSKSTV